jgi:outer membrane protein TolC
MRALVLAALLAIATSATADVLTRAAGGAAGGGGPPSPSAMENDLVAWAGEPHAITLPDLLQQAVRQAPALQSAKIDVEIAEAQLAQTWERHAFRLQAQGTGNRTVSFFLGNVSSSRAYGGTADLTRVLPTGGTVDLHVGAQYAASPSFDPITFQPITAKSWTETVALSISQPLLKGAGSRLYDAAEARATLVRDYDLLSRRLAAIQTVQAVISGYWDLVLAERQVAITEQSLALARERLRVTEIGAKGGKIADAEIPAVQQIIATREEDVLNGELAVLTASIALRRATGLPIGRGDLGLRVATDLDIREQPWDLQALLERAFGASPELAQLAKQDQVVGLDVWVTENGLLPQLDAALSAGPIGDDTDGYGPSGAVSHHASPVTAFKNLVALDQLAIQGSLTFSRSLSQWDVRGKVRELRAGREKVRVNAFDVRAQYAQAMARAVAQIELAQRRVVLSQRAIDLANENIKIETNRFNLGTRTNFDVLNRLEDLRQAELRKAQAMIDWHKAETAIQALTGDVLPAYGITVQ